MSFKGDVTYFFPKFWVGPCFNLQNLRGALNVPSLTLLFIKDMVALEILVTGKSSFITSIVAVSVRISILTFNISLMSNLDTLSSP